jgi:hypothetical protein
MASDQRVTALPLRALEQAPDARVTPDRAWEELMKKMLPLFCLGLAACDGSLQGDRRLQRGMTEQEVTQLQGKQAPDRIILRTCGTATPQPFPCKVHVYRTGLRLGRYGSETAVVFEDVRGQWVVSRWL